MRIESSIITSLSELRAIEQQRIADERAAIDRARADELEAKRAAEQAIRDAEERRLREEREAVMRIEQARLDAEREARMRFEAADAAERARLQAVLEQQRMQEENELRRAEIAKQRPAWMLAVTAIALVATIGLGWYAIDRAQERDAAEAQRLAAVREKEDAQRQAMEARQQLDRLATQMDELDAQVAQAEKILLAAQTKADRDAAAAAINETNRQRAAIKRAQAEAEQKRIDAERKGGYHVDVTCLHDAIGCIDGNKPKRK